MLSQSERKKLPSYGIKMMLTLSNAFSQMNDICRNAIIQFSKDIALQQEQQKFVKFRKSDFQQKPKKITVNRLKSDKQQDQFEQIRVRKNKLHKQTRKQIIIPNDDDSSSSSSSQKQSSKSSQKKQNKTYLKVKRQPKLQKLQPLDKSQSIIEQKHQYKISRSKAKDPILQENKQLKVEQLGKRINRSNKKKTIKIQVSESDISSQPSDYKSRRTRYPSSRRQYVSRRKEKKPQTTIVKRPVNGFMHFYQAVKDQVRRKYNVKRLQQLSPMISRQWKKLSPQQQQKYNNIYYAQRDKLSKRGLTPKITLKTQQNKPNINKQQIKQQQPKKQSSVEEQQHLQQDYPVQSKPQTSQVSQNSQNQSQSKENKQPTKVQRPNPEITQSKSKQSSSDNNEQQSQQSGENSNSQSSIPVPKKQKPGQSQPQQNRKQIKQEKKAIPKQNPTIPIKQKQ